MNKLPALQYCNDVIDLKKQIEVTFLSLGERLEKIRDEKLYSPQWETFELFLMDADISPATASKLINIYQRFHKRLGFTVEQLAAAGGWSKLAPLLPVVTTREEGEDWILNRLPVLSRQDAEKEIAEFKTGISMADCEHHNSYIIRVCRDCHDRIRIYEEEKEN
jgi:hypothetical protein